MKPPAARQKRSGDLLAVLLGDVKLDTVLGDGSALIDDDVGAIRPGCLGLRPRVRRVGAAPRLVILQPVKQVDHGVVGKDSITLDAATERPALRFQYVLINFHALISGEFRTIYSN